MKKNYILDTNILLNSGASALYGFDDNNIFITKTTLQELDDKKKAPGELGFKAREVIRELDLLRESGDLCKGVNVGNGILYIGNDRIDKNLLPEGFDITKPDNKIISSCISLYEQYISSKIQTILVTNDISMRINADIIFKNMGADILIQGYENDRYETDDYKGYRETEISDYTVIENLYKKNKEGSFEIKIPDEYKDIVENEFIKLYSGNMSVLGINKNGYFHMIKDCDVKAFGIYPRNMLQHFALYALLAPPEEIPLVILGGPAGTGKTFLALAAGLEKTYAGMDERLYNRILITRNNAIPAHEEHGFLKGTLEEKMAPLLLPYKDSLISLLQKDSKESLEQLTMQMEDLFDSGVIDIFSMAYIRGRSIPDSYIIVDEAQNLTKTQMRDLLTRVSAGSKLILCGDLNQIDAPYLDKYTSGFSFAAKCMKGSLCAEIIFSENECQRSPLASVALNRLL